ncbi:MAG TPA: DUF262 domain-containing protein [Symbiobacteriaceae bacterium]|nr:DUF262 domain-containing protein [Symbiobacteriaceae bacterium]
MNTVDSRAALFSNVAEVLCVDDMTIRQILNFCKEGRLRVPTFQRGFVWDANRVAYLMDSVYKGYPIGSLLIWRTKEKLKFERRLGPFTLPQPDAALPVDYILDGQQRITSIFGVFQTEIQPDSNVDDTWTNIYFDLKADSNAQESQMVAIMPGDPALDPTRYFSLRTLFDTVAYRRATRNLDDDLAEKVDRLQTVFKESRIPVQMISTDDRTTVAIVFERVNQRGVPLDTLQLLTAWTWSEDFDIQRKFQDLTDEFEPFGFKGIGEDNNLLLRCCSAVIAGNASTETLIKLNGATVRAHFPSVVNGLKGAIDFLQKNVQVHSLDNLPYASLLIPLTVFFAAPGNKHVQYTNDQRNTILRWFWRVCLSKRYNSQPVKSIQSDIAEMVKLRNGEASDLGNFTVNVTADDFKREAFRMNNVSTKTFILLLAQRIPRSFVTGSPVSLSAVLKDYNRNEFHHLFPKAYLRSQGAPTYDPDCIANLCFMSRADNNLLGGVAPSKYRSKMPAQIDDILSSAVCPSFLFTASFEEFVDSRADMLCTEALRLIS